MPLYDYECKKCGNEFEALIRTGDTPTCSSCGSQELERLLVTGVAVSSDNTRALNLAAGRKHLSKDRKDKAMAQYEYEKHHREEH